MADFERQKRLYNRFDPHRLPSPEEYVDLEAVRGESVLALLVQSLLFADSDQPFSRLFAGGRGAGKTTELRRFELELESRAFYPIYVDVERTLDVNNCDFADFLIAIAHGVEASLRERQEAGFGAIEAFIRSRIELVKGLLFTTITPTGANISAGAVGVQATSEVPTTRRRVLDEEYEVLAKDAVKAVSELIHEVQDKIVSRSYRGLVLLVDGGDKIVPYRAGSDGVSQHTRIFAQRATQLCGLGCHVLYSVPLSFCYSPDAMNFATTAGAQAIVLPMTSLRGPAKEEPSPTQPGYLAFEELVQKRVATEPIGTVFEAGALERLILASGGSPTALMTLIQDSIARSATLPVTAEAANKAVRGMANSFARAISSEYWDLLRKLSFPTDSPERTPAFTNALYYQFVYEYMNGSSWFEVNPVLRELAQLSG